MKVNGIQPNERRHQLKEFLKGCHKPKLKFKPTRKVSSLKFENKNTRPEKTWKTWKSCAKKKAFKSQGEATEYMNRSKTNFGNFEGRVYLCDICGRYHITIRHFRH